MTQIRLETMQEPDAAKRDRQHRFQNGSALESSFGRESTRTGQGVTTMRTMTIKNLPDDLYLQLKARAEEHHRSLNGEAVAAIELWVHSQRRSAREIIEDLERMRERHSIPPLTDETLEIARRERL